MSRPKLSWSDLAGARVGIWGLGREGHASLRKLATLGAEPVLVDDRPSDPVDGHQVLVTGDGGLAALETCDAVVKTPGLSRYRPEVAHLSAAGIPVVSLSIGDTARFLFGGVKRRDPVQVVWLGSGDAFVFGGPARLRYHGVTRIVPGTASHDLGLSGRFNLTFRQY